MQLGVRHTSRRKSLERFHTLQLLKEYLIGLNLAKPEIFHQVASRPETTGASGRRSFMFKISAFAPL
jgi:hypothetical protein